MEKTNLLQHMREEQLRLDHLVQWSDESHAAVVIDGENISPKSIGFIQAQAERLGALSFQLVLGNWSSDCLNGWERMLISHRLEPRHHGLVAAGKNATDIDVVVTVMHLYILGIRKFCIAASDSDYTPLVEFLCAQGCLVMGIGKATTPSALQEACSVFVTIPAPQGKATPRSGKNVPHPQGAHEDVAIKMSHEELQAWLLEELSSYEPAPYAWVQVPQFWVSLARSPSPFKPKAYGYKNIRVMLQAFPEAFQLRPYKGQACVHEVRRVERKTCS